MSIEKYKSKKTKEEHAASLMRLSDKCFWFAISIPIVYLLKPLDIPLWQLVMVCALLVSIGMYFKKNSLKAYDLIEKL